MGGKAVAAKPNNGVMQASLWRMREAKRQAAKARDKEEIHMLHSRVSEFERELQRWWSWYMHRHWQESDEDPGGGNALLTTLPNQGAVGQDGGIALQTTSPVDYCEWDLPNHGDECQGGGMALQMTSPIDYSSWDSIVCSSDESHWLEEDEDHEDDEDDEGEVEQDFEGIDDHYFEGGDDHYFDGGDDHCFEDGDEDRVDEKGGTEKDEEVAVAIGIESDEQCEQNRQRCLARLAHASSAIQEAFDAAFIAAAENPKLCDALKTQQSDTRRQFNTYTTHIAGMRSTEFTDTGQLETLINTWQAQLLTSIQGIIDACEEIAMNPPRGE